MLGDLTKIRFEGDEIKIPQGEIGTYMRVLAIAAGQGIATRPVGAGAEITVGFRDQAEATLVQAHIQAALHQAAL